MNLVRLLKLCSRWNWSIANEDAEERQLCIKAGINIEVVGLLSQKIVWHFLSCLLACILGSLQHCRKPWLLTPAYDLLQNFRLHLKLPWLKTAAENTNVCRTNYQKQGFNWKSSLLFSKQPFICASVESRQKFLYCTDLPCLQMVFVCCLLKKSL